MKSKLGSITRAGYNAALLGISSIDPPECPQTKSNEWQRQSYRHGWCTALHCAAQLKPGRGHLLLLAVTDGRARVGGNITSLQ